MTRALLVAAFLVATSSVVVAGPPIGVGGYAGLGLGPGMGVSLDGDGVQSVGPGGRSGQIFGGIRLKGAPIISRFGIEASAAVGSFVVNDAIGYDSRTLALAAKYSHPLGGGMDLFGKLGIAHTSAETDSSAATDVDGAQGLLAVGAEFRIPMKVQLSVVIDYSIYIGSLESDRGSLDGNIRFWKLGFTIGF
jgi:opacity protein-like surface antigen